MFNIQVRYNGYESIRVIKRQQNKIHLGGDVNLDEHVSEAQDIVIKGLGTLVADYDYDYVSILVERKGYSNGNAYWNIPWHYKITDGSGTNYLFKNLRQLHEINTQGDMSLSKGGSKYTSKLNDPTTSWSQTNCQ